jgi:ProP effector
MTPDERQKREAVIRDLAAHWPQCFAVNATQRRPLKIGIAEEVRAMGLFTDAEVSEALTFYAHNTGYLKALVAGAVRIGLDGEPAGTVTADQEAFAQRELARRETKQDTKSDAARRRPILSLPSLRSTQRQEKP